MKRNKHHTEVRKLRSDALWNKFTPEQRETLEHWLFEENLSYTETHERAQKELGLTCSRATIGRIYQRRLIARGMADVADAQDAAEALERSGADVETLRAGNLKLILTRFQQKALKNAEVAEIVALGRLMLQSEEKEIQRERVALARERFEFKAAQAALKALPLASEMQAEEEEREHERIDMIKRRLFGDELIDQMEADEMEWENREEALTDESDMHGGKNETTPSPALPRSFVAGAGDELDDGRSEQLRGPVRLVSPNLT